MTGQDTLERMSGCSFQPGAFMSCPAGIVETGQLEAETCCVAALIPDLEPVSKNRCTPLCRKLLITAPIVSCDDTRGNPVDRIGGPLA